MLKAGVWGFAGIDGSFCVRFSKGLDGCQKKKAWMQVWGLWFSAEGYGFRVWGAVQGYYKSFYVVVLNSGLRV